MHFKNIAFFCLVFHVTLNNRNTKLKAYRVHWSSLDIQIALHASFKAVCFVFKNCLRYGVKSTNCDLMYAASPDLSFTFSIMKQRPSLCYTEIAVLASSIK